MVSEAFAPTDAAHAKAGLDADSGKVGKKTKKGKSSGNYGFHGVGVPFRTRNACRAFAAMGASEELSE